MDDGYNRPSSDVITTHGGNEVSDYRSTLDVFYKNWKEFMDTVTAAIAPLTADQLSLRAAPNERSVGEIAQHIVKARIEWLCDFIRESGDEIAPYRQWDTKDAPTRDAAELVQGLNITWNFMAERFARWTSEDMQFTFPKEWGGQHYDNPRSWVVWHVLEHDLQHAGEISLTLGMHGLQAPRP